MTVAGVGTVLEGKYEIVESLGAGGMGEVFLARHLHLDEVRVVKVLRQDLATDEESQKRFLREARLATQIKHPNVAILHDCTRLPSGSFYMVWEHVEGRNVKSWLDAGTTFEVPVAVDLGIQALRGLEAIHAIGVIHRDVSPDNLMIFSGPRQDLRLKIIDLGLARTLAHDPGFEITQVGTFMGKLAYCSPEQARMTEGATLDRRTDLYSLALVLYEMICGALPFAGKGPAAVYQRVREEPLPLAGRNPDIEVPPVLDRVVMRALARDREERFPDAVSFIEALDDVRLDLAELRTQKIPAVGGSGGDGGGPAGGRAGAPRRRHRRTGELTAEERQALLAQIEEAGQRPGSGPPTPPATPEAAPEQAPPVDGEEILAEARGALGDGRLDEARELVDRVRDTAPATPGLGAVETSLHEEEEAAAHRERVRELETLLTGYIQKKQKQLANLAFESLVELAPTHPRRSDFETWIGMLDEEMEQDERIAAALAAGRRALADGDFKRARRQVDALRKLDPDAADRFARELARSQGEAAESAEVVRQRETFEEALEAGDLEAAGNALVALRGKLSRLTLDAYGDRLERARRSAAREEAEAVADLRYRERAEAGDWSAARAVARDLGERFPDSARPVEMLAEVGHLEDQARRRAAVRDGELHVEALIARGEPDQAALALKVLLQLDPDNPLRRKFETQIDQLRGA